ncbi:hypothetical protein TD95_001287 [Thielaviopsis punctulata]|uniref:Uncharacterized protein n=1 Tax=Thielaviopsis punctulata TaxID=72032 RepID=A0A0F4ZCA8_9PEZI|nr:hypothetical protein TD95_001287 [Thielaviopsis punctulata]
MPSGPIRTPLTEALGIRYPIVQGAMALYGGPELAAAVSNAGGLGILACYKSSPAQLRADISALKAALHDSSLPFGINLPVIKTGSGARKTNRDYNGGRLDELLEVVAHSGARLFVSAGGLPPSQTIDTMHARGILVGAVIGQSKHARKAFEIGMDLVVAQGAEAGGHTTDVGSAVLLPAVLDVAREFHPPLLNGHPALVLAAGGIADGRGLAAALVAGAAGACIGTRFLASNEAQASARHKQAVVQCGVDGTEMTLVVTGRPLRVQPNWYVRGWHKDRASEIHDLCAQGVVPMKKDEKQGKETELPFLMGQAAGLVRDIKPAAEIVEDIVKQAVELLERGHMLVDVKCRL